VTRIGDFIRKYIAFYIYINLTYYWIKNKNNYDEQRPLS
jgi:hypothetical protein